MAGDVPLQLLGTDKEKGFLLDPYLDWVAAEGLPVHQGFNIDAFESETAPWPRFGCNGAFLHVTGRGDFCSVYLLDIDPGKSIVPSRHLYECFVYVLEGVGSTVIERSDGSEYSFEWGPKSLFAIPLNARYRIYNGSGSKRALLGCTSSLPLTFNLYHNEKFVFENDFDFEDRFGDPKHFQGEGVLQTIKAGRHMWETVFVPDLTDFELQKWRERGGDGSNIAFILAEGTMHAHTSEIPAARYKKGHRHSDGVHIWAVTGEGYSMLWGFPGEEGYKEVTWKHGVMYAPPNMIFHQHFNVTPRPARYLAVSIGSRRYPFWRIKRESAGGKVDTDIKKGGNQVEFADQDPWLHEKWLAELEKNGVEPDMAEYAEARVARN